MNFRRILGAAAVVVLGSAALAGCTMSLEEVQESPHKVIETDTDFWAGRSWSYVSPDGAEKPLTENCGGFWEGRCLSTSDGSVEFRWSTRKGGVIANERLTIDGTEYPLECVSTDFWDGTYVCGMENH